MQHRHHLPPFRELGARTTAYIPLTTRGHAGMMKANELRAIQVLLSILPVRFNKLARSRVHVGVNDACCEERDQGWSF
jgi:hypothetical protein